MIIFRFHLFLFFHVDSGEDEMRSASTSSREDTTAASSAATASGRPPTGKSWTGSFMRSNSFLRSNSLPAVGGGGGGGGVETRQWWENVSCVRLFQIGRSVFVWCLVVHRVQYGGPTNWSA